MDSTTIKFVKNVCVFMFGFAAAAILASTLSACDMVIGSPPPPLDKISVSINGTAKVGHTLAAVVGTNLTGAKIYVWTRGETQVGTNYTYTIVDKDKGQTITLTVTIGDKSKSANKFVP